MTITAGGTLTPVGGTGCRWTGGLWADQASRTRSVTVPGIWSSLTDPEVSPGWRNFRIAAGEIDGEHAGPPFLDGDLYKWLEAAIAVLEAVPDDSLRAQVDDVVRMIASVQREDGYIHTPTLIAARTGGDAAALENRFNFETYNLGHLITTATRHHQVTGSTVLLEVAERAAGFLQRLADEQPEVLARNAICPSHYMGVMALYRETRDPRYLRLAETFLAVRDDFNGGDDNQDRIAVRDQEVVTGHAVRANYLYAGLTDLAAETGDQQLLAVLERLWRDVVDTKLYLTGGCGALYDGASPDGYHWQAEISRVHQAYGRAFQLPHTTAHNESCAAIGMILWSERMLALTGNPRYAEVIEQIAYNTLLASVSLDGRRFFYTNPLRQVRELPFPLRMPGDTALRPIPDPPPSDARLRTEYLSVFCCPPNIARTLAQFQQRVGSVSEDGLWLHLYGDAELTAEHDGRQLRLRITADQPWDEQVRIEIVEATGGGLPLRLRIPQWAEGATVTVGDTAAEPAQPGTYLTVERDWQAGDQIELTLPLQTKIVRGHRLAEDLTNQVAVVRGPVVYCLESTDLPDDVAIEQIALGRNTQFRPYEFELEGRRLTGLEAEVVVLPAAAEEDGLYSELPDGELRTITVGLIPYFAWGNRGPSEMSVWLPVVW